jgi:hypothetical protein
MPTSASAALRLGATGRSAHTRLAPGPVACYRVALNELKIYCFTSFYVQIQKLALGFLYYQKLLHITFMDKRL